MHSEKDAGKTMPINAEPTPKGNVALDFANNTYRVLGKAETADYPWALYESHFVTCPAAAQRRKR